MKVLFPYLQLMRPANIITALTNVISGFAASSYILNNGNFSNYPSLVYLLAATTGLYGGGIVFNDFFDSDIDTIERPNRPIPSGSVTKIQAAKLGSFLFITGLLAALKISRTAFTISLIICVLCFAYNWKIKHYPWLGGLTLAFCRGLNLLLGTTIMENSIHYLWALALIPFGLTIAITSVSQVEVAGNNKRVLKESISFYLLTLFTVLILMYSYTNKIGLYTLFLGLFILVNGFYIQNALKSPTPINIQKVVKWGVLSFIILDATILSSFSNFYYGIMLLCLFPITIILSKFFAVT